jgi:L,D-transpeptidase ErfK/SrfK
LARIETRRARQTRELDSMRPRGIYIVVDSFRNRIRLMKDDQVLLEDICSTGNGTTLADSVSGRTWTFRTPRGVRKVTADPVTDPIWIRPDWAFVEEGLPLPRDARQRAESGVLGDYALAIGDGYFIHGTLYTRLLGYPVTHGCIRVGDDTLAEIVAHARVGTPVFIY